ncbi:MULTISPECIES: glycosyl hydrolase 115 family protein [Chitinophagaceae]
MPLIKIVVSFFLCCLFVEDNTAQIIVVTGKKSDVGIDFKKMSIWVDTREAPTVLKVASLFSEDVEKIVSVKPIIVSRKSKAENIVVIGTIHRSSFIRELITKKKLDTTGLNNKWEGYRIQMVEHPFAGVEKAIVVMGSDRRGAAFGTLELSKQIGVSPWNWWADVPVQKRRELFVKIGKPVYDAPKVQYRGIFINDEAPALSGWAKEKFGGFNHTFYSKVFELLLRLKANYIWPAMWGSAFYDDDAINIKVADTFGIVIGTSHHEPLMRAHDEWRRYGKGKWDYTVNAKELETFWTKGMQRATNEKIVTIGMRGDGDEPMSQQTATTLLENIVTQQRQIIETVTHKPASATPQLWALYKEVQDYYDKGMRVPDDVTLLLCDDNWGNIRRLPDLKSAPRKGGYGIYYHFDYVGDPRNYKWINTNPLPRIWEQMHLAWEYGVQKIWIVNVGDIKPMEFPTSFFLDYAWDPERTTQNDLHQYTADWAAKQFGTAYAEDIALLLERYAQYASRRKPELLDQNTYSLDNYNEYARVTGEYIALQERAEQINTLLDNGYKDAYFQLVLHPIQAMCNLYKMYFYAALNYKAYDNRDAWCNSYADSVKMFYTQDSLITWQYHQLNGGKWNHMMDQTHIGYVYWQQPDVNKIPDMKYRPGGEHFMGKALVPIVPGPNQPNVGEIVENNDVVAFEASHFTRKVKGMNAGWEEIPGLSRTLSGMAIFPVTASEQLPKINAPELQYVFETAFSGEAKLYLYLAPTLNFQHSSTGLRIAVAIDDEKPQTVFVNKDETDVRIWQKWVADNTILKTTIHKVAHNRGKHIIHVWAIDPGVVLQKLILDMGGLKPSYLGPMETIKIN